MPALATFSLTGDPYIDGVLGDGKWATTSLTYSAPGSASYYGSNYGSGEPGDNFAALNSTQSSVLDTTLAMYASVANLTFSEITETSSNHADLRFAMSDKPSTAWAYFPSTASEGGDAWFNNSGGYYDNPVKGNYAYATFLHETGHALALEHPHTGNVTPAERDSLEYSVMSYRSFVGKALNSGYVNESFGYPQSLMMYDIAALQHMYGANYSTNAGNNTYSWSSSTGEMFINGAGQGAPGANRIFLTVWDGGGVDTYDFSNYSTDLNVDLRPGYWTTTSTAQLAKLHYDGSEVAAGNIANALQFNGDPRSLIENARGGSGDDSIMGNWAANTLWGGDGDDVLLGGGGAGDMLFGQAGQDRLVGGSAADLLVGGFGDDRMFGGGGNDIARGGPGNDRLFGGPGDDRLLGGAGDDLLAGGAGGDALIGGGDADVLWGGGGNDCMFGGGGDDVARGGLGEDWLVGGPGDDRLLGGPDNDVLVGGSGSDVLIGGGGEDTFVFRSVNHSSPNAMDTIWFVSGVDTINLGPIDADTTTGGNQAFTFIDSNPFSHAAGELNFRNNVLSGDVDGDGTADFAIQFEGLSVPVDSDFIL